MTELFNLDMVDVPSLQIKAGIIVGRTYSQPVYYDIMAKGGRIYNNVLEEFVEKVEQ